MLVILQDPVHQPKPINFALRLEHLTFGFRVEGFRVQGLGFRVQCLGLRV